MTCVSTGVAYVVPAVAVLQVTARRKRKRRLAAKR
jgi:hypothetical protein